MTAEREKIRNKKINNMIKKYIVTIELDDTIKDFDFDVKSHIEGFLETGFEGIYCDLDMQNFPQIDVAEI